MTLHKRLYRSTKEPAPGTRDGMIHKRRRIQLAVLLGAAEIAFGTGAHTQTPEQLAIVAEMNRTIRRLIETLPREIRNVVVEYYGIYTGCSKTMPEVAEMLGVDAATVRSQLSKGLRLLRHPGNSSKIRTAAPEEIFP